MILVDAGRHDYVSEDNMPFLHSLSQEGTYVRRLSTIHGYAERSSVFTSRPPQEYGYFGNFHRSNKGPFTWLRFASFSGTSNAFKPIRMAISMISKYISGYHFTNVHAVPIKYLHLFDLGEDQAPLYAKGRYNKIKSLFDILIENGKTFEYFDCLESPFQRYLLKKDVLVLMEKKLNRKRDFYYTQLVELDNMGHKLGPSSKEFKEIVQAADKRLKRLITKFYSRFPKGTVILFADHGMTDVKKGINIAKLLPPMSAKTSDTYSYFIDSTSIRVWCTDKARTDKIKNTFLKIKEGKLLTVEDRRRYGLDLPKEHVGDLLFWLEEGSVFFPDFYHPTRLIKGMHGYLEGNDMDGFMIIIGKDIKKKTIEKGHLADLLPTVINLMGLRTNEKMAGKSVN